SASPKPRPCCAEGSAMFTIVASSATISWATAITTRASQRVSRPVVGPRPVDVEVVVVVVMSVSLQPEEISPVDDRQGLGPDARDPEDFSPVWYAGPVARQATRLRADARRNQEQVLQAARDLFVERGID